MRVQFGEGLEVKLVVSRSFVEQAQSRKSNPVIPWPCLSGHAPVTIGASRIRTGCGVLLNP